MIEIQAQIINGNLVPYGPDSVEKLKEYKDNQLVICRVSGSRKQRSLRQLGTYWAVCKTVADNTDNKQWNTKEKVDFQCRVKIHFVDPDLVVVKKNLDVVVQYRSISFANLKHMEACNYFDRAFELMAKFLDVDVDTLISMAKEQMG